MIEQICLFKRMNTFEIQLKEEVIFAHIPRKLD